MMVRWNKDWLRKEKRLVRGLTKIVIRNPRLDLWLAKPLYENHTEILTFIQMKEKMTKQTKILAKYVSFEFTVPQTSPFFMLPEEIVIMIFVNLPIADIITMATTCRSIAQFVYRNFVPRVILPLSAKNLRKLDGRYVLSIRSKFNFMPLEKLKKGDYLTNLKKICLKKLQTLSFFLYDFYEDEHIPINPTHDHIIPPVYKEILTYYVSEASLLTELHISIDRSKKIFDIIDTMSSLPSLRDVSLLAVNTPYNILLPIECEVTQQMRDDDQKFQFPASAHTLNQLLTRLLLKNMSIESLWILGLHSLHIWGEYTYLDRELREERYPLELKSNSLKDLHMEQHGFFYIKIIECPKLLSFVLVDYEAKFKCLEHADIFMNGYETLLEGCPVIERINDIDLKSLRDKLDSENNWQKLLTEMCHCDDGMVRVVFDQNDQENVP